MEGHSAPPGCGAGLYDGVLWNRKPEGEGLMEYLDRCRSPRQGSARCYAGHHVDGKRHGPGQLLLDAEGNGIVAGTFEDNTLVHGTRRYPTGAVFEGPFNPSLQPHGHGTVQLSDGALYTGAFRNGLKHGPGRMELPDGSVFEGIFENDQRHGRGTFRWADGEVYQGDFVHDARHGLGQYNWPDGRQYVGAFAENQRHGEGVFDWPSGNRYEGGYAHDQRSGEGSFTYTDGSVDYGDWHGAFLVRVRRHAVPARVSIRVADTSRHSSDGEQSESESESEREGEGEEHQDAGLETGPPPPGPLTIASQAFQDAAAGNRLEEVKDLFRQGNISIDVRDAAGRTPLYLAAVAGHTDVVRYLLEQAADINLFVGAELTDTGMSAVTAVYRKGIGLPEDRGVGSVPPIGGGLLDLGIYQAVFELLLEWGADLNACTQPEPALFTAVRCRHIKAVEIMLKFGADPNLFKKGTTALHQALFRLPDVEREQERKKPPSSGKSPTRRRGAQQYENIGARDREAEEGDALQILRLLLEANADCNVPDMTHGPPLHIISDRKGRGSLSALKALLKKGALANDLFTGQTPLSRAIINGNDEAVSLLLAHSADPNIRTEDGMTLLQLVCWAEYDSVRSGEGRLDMVRNLLEAGADALAPVDVVNNKGERRKGTVMDCILRDFVDNSDLHSLNPSITTPTEKARIKSQLELMKVVGNELRQKMYPNNSAAEKAVPACLECGRSVFVKLTPCARCQKVLFCSDRCKMRAMSTHHRVHCRAASTHTSKPYTLQTITWVEGSSVRWKPTGSPQPGEVTAPRRSPCPDLSLTTTPAPDESQLSAQSRVRSARRPNAPDASTLIVASASGASRPVSAPATRSRPAQQRPATAAATLGAYSSARPSLRDAAANSQLSVLGHAADSQARRSQARSVSASSLLLTPAVKKLAEGDDVGGGVDGKERPASAGKAAAAQGAAAQPAVRPPARPGTARYNREAANTVISLQTKFQRLHMPRPVSVPASGARASISARRRAEIAERAFRFVLD